MYGRRTAALLVASASIIGLYLVSTQPEPAAAAEACPPVTLDVLFPPTTLPPETTTTLPTTTTAPPVTTTTTPATTTVPATTTTTPTTTTTIDDGETTTTAPEPTTTTALPATTAPPATTTTVPATTTLPPPPACDPFVYDMAWPLAGVGAIGSEFGADRDGGARKHEGNDIAAPKLTPVVAVADGVVTNVVQDQGTPHCCYAIIGHADGWSSYYIHLNNDVFGTDDGLGVGVRTDLVTGAPVRRGEVIGWVGDSGNAEDTIDHLHFELHDPQGLAVDPRPSLLAAQSAMTFAEPQPGWPYTDDDGRPGEPAAALLLTRGLLLGCDGSALNFCPDQPADPQFASLVADHYAGKTTPRLEGKYQPVTGTAMCPPVDTCLLHGLTEADIARLAIWVRIDALVATLRSNVGPEDVREVFLPTAEEADAKLRDIGARAACNPPLDQARVLTRDEAVHRMVSWMSGQNPQPCPPPGQ